ncbi:MAG: septum formation initiator family protein [Pseudomonadales bacterium]
MAVRLFIALLVLGGLSLQYKFWFSDVGFFRIRSLDEDVAKQSQRLDRLTERNRILAAEVRAQKHGLDAVEARARSDLGMVKAGETFYLVNAEHR